MKELITTLSVKVEQMNSQIHQSEKNLLNVLEQKAIECNNYMHINNVSFQWNFKFSLKYQQSSFGVFMDFVTLWWQKRIMEQVNVLI